MNRKIFLLKDYLSEKRIVIDKKITSYLNEKTVPGRLSDAMRYAVMAGGKRIRPILCIAAGEAVCGTFHDTFLATGCAIELIHTYSLIHDDLPAMDDDTLRRGNPTCHMAFDEATAILSGDALLTIAFEILASQTELFSEQPENLLRVIGIISKAAGARGMVEGQMRDILAEGATINLSNLEKLHNLKTGAMITASVETGALLAGATDEQQENLRQYALNLGTAFQVADDLLNVEGDPSVMGKAVGTDAAKMKSTYPALLGLDKSKEKAHQLIDNALKALDAFGATADPLRAIAAYVIERKR